MGANQKPTQPPAVQNRPQNLIDTNIRQNVPTTGFTEAPAGPTQDQQAPAPGLSLRREPDRAFGSAPLADYVGTPQHQAAQQQAFAPQPAQNQGLLGQLGNRINTPLSFANAPGIRPTNQIQQTAQFQQTPLTYRPGGMVAPGQTFGVNPNAAVGPSQTFSFNPQDYGQQGAELERATFERGLNRVDPYFEQQRAAMAQRLANQGLPIGSEAYNEELNRFDRSRSDALENLALSSIGAGRAEQGRLFGQELARLGFNAAEQGRGFGERLASNQANFGQRLASGQFDASEAARNFAERLGAQGQFFGQNLAGDQFGAGQRQLGFQNAFAGDQFRAQQQSDQFRQDLARRQQSIGEQQTLRQQPFTELSQLLALAGQVGQPSFGPLPQYGPQRVGYDQLTNQQYLGDLNAWQQDRANRWGLIGGLGSAFIPFIPGLGG